ncbi:MAG: Dipeptidyl-peptidase 6 [Firmicutes bacterium]|nr:Dipeptidyl-peptidase 6 [Bacillota bacterium]
MQDLKKYPMIQEAAMITLLLNSNGIILAERFYHQGVLVTDKYKKSLLDKCNFTALYGMQTLKYGVTVRHSNLRGLPTNDALYSSAEDTEFDNLQETAIDPSEPVILLHQSLDNDFYFIQTYNAYGWVAAKDIAMINERISWLRYIKPEWFFVVIDKSFQLNVQGEKLLYQMGSKLLIQCIANDQVKVVVPTRKANGYLEEIAIAITPSSSLHKGYLTYTRNHLLEQGFRFLDEPYGWGGLHDSVDCSSLVNAVYRSVGIDLPRNSGQQENAAGIHYTMHGLSRKERYQLISELQPGDTLHMNGHVMMYLGEINNTPYVLHSLGSYTNHFTDGSYEKVAVMQVVVSDLNLKRYNGMTFIDDLTTAVSFRSLL